MVLKGFVKKKNTGVLSIFPPVRLGLFQRSQSPLNFVGLALKDLNNVEVKQ